MFESEITGEILCLLCFSVGSSLMLGQTLCKLFNELALNKEAKEKKKLRHFKP
mgnify:CR=1 FL=1